MTLLTVPWLLPQASVEYAWVQPLKLLFSALKSVGNPTQQMGGVWVVDQKENLLKEKERRGGNLFDLSSMVEDKPNSLHSCRPFKESGTRASMLAHTVKLPACTCTDFGVHVHLHAAVCVLEYGSAWMWVSECLRECLSISFCLKS